ncbi:rhomboid family intramembrane serine protease [Yoonia sp. 2307UL14-13]|uniref:rhomboid family intramembrane serine protease n=1 Tax=Yoonia sp. 2307UL14-13 TaxID=3126506 RepID=UPI0030AEBCC4
MDELRSCFVTLTTCLLLVAAYAVTGATLSAGFLDTFGESLTGVLRHGSLMHLSGNILVIFFGGLLAEARLGPTRFALLILACALGGTVAQYLIEGPRFIGASGVSYGLLAYGVIVGRTERGVYWAALAVATLIFLEIMTLSQHIAVYVHAAGALIGGSLAMFETLFGGKDPTLKPMQPAHIARVVEIIAQTDDDDAEEAEENFLEDGLEGMFVLMQKGEVLGCIGYSVDDQVPDIAWLSWTYLDKKKQSQGLGGNMMNDLLGKLKGYGVRKLFIATSDYEEFGRKIYADAHKMYADFGANVELTIPDYHNPGEAKIVYGLDNPEFVAPPPAPASEQTGIAITDIGKEPETKKVYGLRWEERPVGVAGLEYALGKARDKGARMTVLALPSDLSDANAVALESHNFKRCGALKNYYNPALHQVWWVCL